MNSAFSSVFIAMVEQYMRSLKLGAMAKRWREVTFTSPEQYICELMELELKSARPTG